MPKGMLHEQISNNAWLDNVLNGGAPRAKQFYDAVQAILADGEMHTLKELTDIQLRRANGALSYNTANNVLKKMRQAGLVQSRTIHDDKDQRVILVQWWWSVVQA